MGGFRYVWRIMEYFDLYDRDGIKLNKSMKRGTTNNLGEYHRVVHIWIKNDQNQYLIQQRNKSTDRYPYQWAPTAGAVIKGETSFQAALREVKEEIGLSVSKHELIYIDSLYVDNTKANYIIDLFQINKNIRLGSLNIDKTEVKDVSYKTKKEILEMIDNKEFWNFHKDIPTYDYFSILEKREI